MAYLLYTLVSNLLNRTLRMTPNPQPYDKELSLEEDSNNWVRIGLENLRKQDEAKVPLILQTIHTTPPNRDYVAPTTKSILDELLEEFRDEILDITMVDEEADFNPTKDIEELECLITEHE
ncbi:hypothetical protein Tco_1419084 [Tanacetum coccineum]